jgi:hypothetical protein
MICFEVPPERGGPVPFFFYSAKRKRAKRNAARGSAP